MQMIVRDKEVSSFKKSLLPNDDGYASSRRGTKWLPEDPYPVIQLRLVQEGEEVIIENLKCSKPCPGQTLIEHKAYKRVFGDYRSRMTTT